MTLTPIKYQEGTIWVDKEANVYGGDTVYDWEQKFISVVFSNYTTTDFEWKVVAQSPNLSIEEVPYVEVEEDVEVDSKFVNSIIKFLRYYEDKDLAKRCLEAGYRKGYKAASAKKYTEGDLLKAIDMAWDNSDDTKNRYDILQSLQPQIKSIEIEMEIDESIEPISTGNYPHKDDYYYKPVTYIKEGKTFLKVKKINYE